MFDIWMSVYIAFLFIILTPDVLVCIPKRGSTLTNAVVHGIIFALVYHFTNKHVFKAIYGSTEGMSMSKPKPTKKM